MGCGRRVEASSVRREMLRVVLARQPEGPLEAHVDLRATGKGRGAWVHARRDCLSRASAKGLARSAKGRVHAEPARLEAEIVAQAERRGWSLLVSARRAGHLAAGADAVADVLRAGTGVLIVLARDARAAAAAPGVSSAIASGSAVAWSTKRDLGAALGKTELGIVAITDCGIAETFRHAVSLIETFGRPSEGGPTVAPEKAERD